MEFTNNMASADGLYYKPIWLFMNVAGCNIFMIMVEYLWYRFIKQLYFGIGYLGPDSIFGNSFDQFLPLCSHLGFTVISWFTFSPLGGAILALLSQIWATARLFISYPYIYSLYGQLFTVSDLYAGFRYRFSAHPIFRSNCVDCRFRYVSMNRPLVLTSDSIEPRASRSV